MPPDIKEIAMHRCLAHLIHALPFCLLTLAFADDARAQTAFSAHGGPPLEVLQKADPFQDNNGQIPPGSEYAGPLFTLNHNWPTTPDPLKNAPWQEAIGNGPITIDSAAAYADALKEAVTENSRALIMHYDSWDAAKAGWYNEPWLGTLRESIHGSYPAGEFGPAIFPDTGLRATFQTHVLTYYDQRAAYSLYNFWGNSAMQPTLKTENAQFVEGSIITKAAMFASTDPNQPTDWWDAMDGAQEWPLYIPVGNATTPSVWPSYIAQFDIIVKDTQSAPQTLRHRAISGIKWCRSASNGAMIRRRRPKTLLSRKIGTIPRRRSIPPKRSAGAAVCPAPTTAAATTSSSTGNPS
jgi:hypothetical protein